MGIKGGAIGLAVLFTGAVVTGVMFREYRKAEAATACKAVVDQISEIQKLPQQEQMRQIAKFDETALQSCVSAVEAIPLPTNEQRSSLRELDRFVSYMPLLKGLAGFASGFGTPAPTPSPVTVPVAATPSPAPNPVPIVSFDQLGPCDQLDAVARSGKSVSQFLVAAHKVGDLNKYKAAIGSTCPWNAEQLQVADRVINPPVVVVKPRVIQRVETVRVESSQPDRVVRVDRPTRQREHAVEGTCYHADPSQCPREFNGNPHDNPPAHIERRDAGERRSQFKSLEW